MDPLTHALLGANLGYAACGRRLGRTAAWAGAWAAFIPDADVFIRSDTDPLLAVEYHRHFTHALSFAPVGAAVAAACWWWRPIARAHPWYLWFCCLLAYTSHALLDTATSYGTQLLWPFSRARLGWDAISIIDPVFTIGLAVGLAWALLKIRYRVATVALVFAVGYVALGVLQHERAQSAQQQIARSRGHRIERSEVMPGMANHVIWRALYTYRGQIYSDRVRVGWFSAPRFRKGWSLPVVQASDLSVEEQARNSPADSFDRFAWFSQGWVARSPDDASLLADMRYSLSSAAFDPIWGIRFGAPGAPTPLEWVNRSRDRSLGLAEMWREISGRDARYLPVPAN